MIISKKFVFLRHQLKQQLKFKVIEKKVKSKKIINGNFCRLKNFITNKETGENYYISEFYIKNLKDFHRIIILENEKFALNTYNNICYKILE